MALAATLAARALLTGGALLAGAAAAVPTGAATAAAAAGGDVHAALRAATRQVQVTVLKSGSGPDGQADRLARVMAAEFDQERFFTTLRIASARYSARPGGAAADMAAGDGGLDLSHLPGEQSAAPNGVVTLRSGAVGGSAGGGSVMAVDGRVAAAAVSKGALSWGC